ncbi:MAG: hypothetical protein FWH12_02455 [Treponema sp.]|nr:hypothetical protein [Treponema sp.]
MNTPVVQLENVLDFNVQFTAYDSPIWRARLWCYNYEKKLPFMNDEQRNNFAFELFTVIIDYVPYMKVTSFDGPNGLRANDRTWMVDPDDNSLIYIHFEDHNPSFSFISYKNGIMFAFSHGNPVQLGDAKTYPLLESFPQVEDQSDNFTYQKMRFSSGNITIDNSAGMLDSLVELFGNDVNLSMFTNNELDIIRSYFIERYTLGLTKIDLTVKDKRSRLTFQAPNTFYTREEFPDIEENLIGKVIQDAYGYCRGVPGTCVNRNELYQNPAQPTEDTLNNWFIFKFARTISEIDKIWVKKSDVWTQIFPGLGIPDNRLVTSGDSLETWQEHHPVGTRPRIVTKDALGNDVLSVITDMSGKNLPTNADGTPNDGRIAIWRTQATKENPGHLHRANGNPEVVKMDGVFVDLHTPGEIVSDMMHYYGDRPYVAQFFDMDEWETEMRGGKEIGVCLDKADDIYSWVEKIQNGSMLGFQVLIYKDRFSARVDNPNRKEDFDIHWSEILNRDAIAPEMNGDAYASFATINYSYEYTEKEYKSVIDKSLRNAILDVYKYEKEYHNDSFLVRPEDAERKAKIVLENFMEVRPYIRGIELEGLRWDEIKLFSTGYIDFTMELPRQMRAIQKYMARRNAMGRMRVKVLRCSRDLKSEKTIIDVIGCDPLEALREA